MRMAKAFIAAVPLTLVLLTAVVVALAVTPGSFGFHSLPASPSPPPRENAVVIDEPVGDVTLARADKPAAKAATPTTVAYARRHDRSTAGSRQRPQSAP